MAAIVSEVVAAFEERYEPAGPDGLLKETVTIVELKRLYKTVIGEHPLKVTSPSANGALPWTIAKADASQISEGGGPRRCSRASMTAAFPRTDDSYWPRGAALTGF